MRRLFWQSVSRKPLTEPPPLPDDAALAELATRLEAAAKARLGRSLAIREVDAGSCNGCELEIHALNNAIYDLERYGIRFVASPRHADVLLVTGPVTQNMRDGAGAHLARHARSQMGRRGRRLRGQWRAVRRLRFGGRRRARGGAGRPPHPRLPADARAAARWAPRAFGA